MIILIIGIVLFLYFFISSIIDAIVFPVYYCIDHEKRSIEDVEITHLFKTK